MGLDLVIVTELSETNNTMEHEEKGRFIANFSCNWYHDAGFRLTSTQFTYTKTRELDDDDSEIEFTSGDDLIKFGKSLIDLVIPHELINGKYQYEHLFSIIDEFDYFNFLTAKIKNKINVCNKITELKDVIEKYNNKLNIYLDLSNRSEIGLVKYIDCFEHTDIDIIKRMVNFGLQVIDHGKKGYKAYWSY